MSHLHVYLLTYWQWQDHSNPLHLKAAVQKQKPSHSIRRYSSKESCNLIGWELVGTKTLEEELLKTWGLHREILKTIFLFKTIFRKNWWHKFSKSWKLPFMSHFDHFLPYRIFPWKSSLRMDWQTAHVHTTFPVTAEGPIISIHIIQLLIAQFIIVHFITHWTSE